MPRHQFRGLGERLRGIRAGNGIVGAERGCYQNTWLRMPVTTMDKRTHVQKRKESRKFEEPRNKHCLLQAIFGEDGTSIDTSTAAALLAATCSGGDPEIGARLAELLVPEMDDKVDPTMMAALMSACSLINAGAGTEEVKTKSVILPDKCNVGNTRIQHLTLISGPKNHAEGAEGQWYVRGRHFEENPTVDEIFWSGRVFQHGRILSGE